MYPNTAQWDRDMLPPWARPEGLAPPPDPKSPHRIRYVHALVMPVADPDTSAVRPPFSRTSQVVVVSVMSTATQAKERENALARRSAVISIHQRVRP